jgi:acetoin utilization protein AcuC
MTSIILYREELKEYDFGPGHPFRGDRYEVFPRFLKQNLPDDGENYRVFKAEPVGDEDLALICRQEYVDFTRGFYRAANEGLPWPGDLFSYQSEDNRPRGKPGKIEEAARLVIGQAKAACDLVMGGKTQKAISIGGGMHHAKPNYGEGFCIYNDVAYAGRYLQHRHKLDRILVLDTDAHAGNGTSDYFYEDGNVLFIDIHQDPMTLYPSTGFADQVGAGKGKGFTINIPLPVYAGRESYRKAFDQIIHPVVQEFKPQIIIRNGGSDPHIADGLANLGLQVSGFAMIGEEVRKIADLCEGREIDLIGSGYNREILPYAWLALVCGVTGIKNPVTMPPAVAELDKIPSWVGVDRFSVDTDSVIADVKYRLKSYWKCLR